MKMARTPFFSMVAGVGVMLLVSPFALYWFIHGDYDRYIWIISGPFPFSHFGGGPFQMVMYLVLFFSGAFLVASYFLRNNLRRMAFVLAAIAAMPVLIYGSLIFFDLRYQCDFYKSESAPFYPTPLPTIFLAGDCQLSGSGSSAPVTSYFSEIVQSGVIDKTGGRPIEGFEPSMFTEAYPGLQASDFNCVKAYGGFYVMRNDQIIFISERINAQSTADRSIVAYGMNRLLQNIADRLGLPWPHTNAEADVIINAISVFSVSGAPQEKTLPSLEESKISVPDGWYLHRIAGYENVMMLTRQEELPDIGATEGWAYGEQINIAVHEINTPWLAELISCIADDAYPPLRQWEEIGGREFLRTERPAAGAGGKVLTYHFFKDNLIYQFSLYPSDLYDSEPLMHVLQEYMARL